MIFPEVSLKDWIKKYPELKLIKINCSNCGKLMTANKPFLSKGYAGIMAPNCECGKNRNGCESMVTTSEAEHKRWTKILGEL